MKVEFWSWLFRSYRDGEVGDEPRFTKWNMEAAFNAGVEAGYKQGKIDLSDECAVEFLELMKKHRPSRSAYAYLTGVESCYDVIRMKVPKQLGEI